MVYNRQLTPSHLRKLHSRAVRLSHPGILSTSPVRGVIPQMGSIYSYSSVMDARQITTLMHRLFYGDIPHVDGWVHLVVDGKLNRDKVNQLINRYIAGDEVILFVDTQNCAFSSKENAFQHVEKLIEHGTVRIADPIFHARILINPIGVGVGSAL